MVKEGRVVTLYGDRSQQRDFAYVEDIARGTIAGIKLLGYDVINLASDRPMVLMDAIHPVEELVGVKAVIEHLLPRPADAEATWVIFIRRKPFSDGGPNAT